MIVNGTFFTRLFDENDEEFEVSEEEMAKAFACCLKELRKFKGYTLKQVADGTGIPIPTVQRYESGENTPSVIQAFKLAYFYKIELTDMFLAGYIDDDSREKFFEKHFGRN